MKKSQITLLILFLSMNLFSQKHTIKNITLAKDISKKVAQLFIDTAYEKAFDQLTPYWPLPQNEIDGVESKTIKYLNMLEKRFGKSIGFRKVKEEHILDIVVRETYLIRYEYTAIRLIFTYYKNDNGWIINAFKWDDSFDEELE